MSQWLRWANKPHAIDLLSNSLKINGSQIKLKQKKELISYHPSSEQLPLGYVSQSMWHNNKGNKYIELSMQEIGI